MFRYAFFSWKMQPQRNKQTPMFSHPLSTERSELLLRHKIPNNNNPSPQQPPPETCFKSHRIHVWYIYLHLGDLYRVHVGNYTVCHMDPLRTLPSNSLPPTRSVSSAAIRLLKVAIVQPWKSNGRLNKLKIIIIPFGNGKSLGKPPFLGSWIIKMMVYLGGY